MHSPFDPTHEQRTFHLSASDFFTEQLVPQLMARLGALAPGLRLRVTDRVPPGRLWEMREGDVDLLILADEAEVPGFLERAPAFRSGFSIIARRAPGFGRGGDWERRSGAARSLLLDPAGPLYAA